MVVPNDWDTFIVDTVAAKYIPTEWSEYQNHIYVLPVSDTQVKVVGSDKISPLVVSADGEYNKSIDITKIHFEVPSGWRIDNFPVILDELRVRIAGFVMPYRYRYLQFQCLPTTWAYIYPYELPSFGQSKPKHMVFSAWDLTISVFNYGCYTVDGNIRNAGRRTNYPGSFADQGDESLHTINFWKKQPDSLGIYGVQNPPGYEVFSNKTIVKCYGRVVKK